MDNKLLQMILDYAEAVASEAVDRNNGDDECNLSSRIKKAIIARNDKVSR